MTLQGILARLAPVMEWVGALVAAIAAIFGQFAHGVAPLNAWTVIAAVVAALGHATQHTIGSTTATTRNV